MKKLLPLFLFLMSAPSWGAVAWNSNSSASFESGSPATSPSTDTNMTVGSGANRALLCLVAWEGVFTGPGTITVNWDSTGTNQAMTLIGSGNTTTNTCSVQFYGLIAPTSGNKTLRVAWTAGTSGHNSWCSDFTGVNQTSVAAAFTLATNATGTSTTPSITITSNANDLTVDGGNNSTIAAPAGSPSKTLIFSVLATGQKNPWSSRSAGAASNVHSWTITSAAWVEIGVDIVAAAAAAASGSVSKSQRYQKDDD